MGLGVFDFDFGVCVLSCDFGVSFTADTWCNDDFCVDLAEDCFDMEALWAPFGVLGDFRAANGFVFAISSSLHGH